MNPRTTSTVVTEVQRIELELAWHVPQGTEAGDTIVQVLPASLNAGSFQGFDVTDAAGRRIAVATLGEDSQGRATVVFTFTPEVEVADASGTSGTARFSLSIDRGGLDFVDGAAVIPVFGQTVRVTEVGPRDLVTRKTGNWTPNQATATATNPDGSLVQESRHQGWGVAIETGDWTETLISEGVQNGLRVNCESTRPDQLNGFGLRVWDETREVFVAFTQSAATAQLVTATCETDGSFAVRITKPAGDGAYYRLDYAVDLITDDQGRPVYTNASGDPVVGFAPTYRNEATVTIDGDPRPVGGNVIGQTGSGTGTNVNAPVIDIELYSSETAWAGVQFDANGRPIVTPAPDYEPVPQPADDYDTAPGAELVPGEPQPVRFTVTNLGSEPLTDLVVTDAVTAGAALTDISCNFSAIGGPATGSDGGDGVLPRQGAFACTATLPALAAGGAHVGTATVDGVGTVTGGEVTDTDAWAAYAAGGASVSVGNCVWLDTDGDGVREDGEPGIAGVVLTLTGPDGRPVTDVLGNPVGPVTTTADCGYLFANLPVLADGQSYVVTVDPSSPALSRLSPTQPGVGDRSTDSSTGSATSTGLTTAGSVDDTLDFGFVPGSVSAGDCVWFDTDGDGVQDPEEPGIAGVTLTLTGPDGLPVTDVFGSPVEPVATTADCAYLFTRLPLLADGQAYTVTVDADSPALDGLVPTLEGVGDPTTDSSTGSAASAALTTPGASDPTLDFGFVEGAVNPSPTDPDGLAWTGTGGALPLSVLGLLLVAAGVVLRRRSTTTGS